MAQVDPQALTYQLDQLTKQVDKDRVSIIAAVSILACLPQTKELRPELAKQVASSIAGSGAAAGTSTAVEQLIDMILHRAKSGGA